MVSPRYTLRSYFDPAHADHKVNSNNLLLVDGITHPIYESDYAYSGINIKTLMLTHNVDVLFLIKNLRTDPPTYGASGPSHRIYHTGIQPITIDKWSTDGTLSNDATLLLEKCIDEIYRVIDVYYASDDKAVGATFPETQRINTEEVIYGDTVEVLTKFYMYSVSTGTESIQRWTSIKIGYDSTHYTEITDGILDFPYAKRHPAARLDAANPVSADDMSQGHSSFMFQIILDGDKRDAFFTQAVTGLAGNPALDDDGDSSKILYFVVSAKMRGPTGTTITRTYTVTNGYVLENSYEGGNRFIYVGNAEMITPVDV